MRAAIIAAVLAAAALGSAAQDLDYDFGLDMRQRRVVDLYVRTRYCLGVAARAIMKEGVKDSAQVQHFMVTVCGDTFYQQLRRDGMPEEQARRTLIALTRVALYRDVLLQDVPSK